MTPRKWLITGGCGFIGLTLINRLKKLDAVSGIRVVDNLSVGSPEDLASVTDFTQKGLEALDSGCEGVELVAADIRDFESAARTCRGMDVVVHLAANTGVQPSIADPLADMDANVRGTLNYLEAARRNHVGAFVFASSGAPMGNAEPPFHEDVVCRPVSPYGASKLAGEAYCSAYFASFGLKTSVLRFSNAYGPLSVHKGSVAALFIKQALAGEAWVLNGGGSQTRDFIFSEDLAEAIVRATEAGKGGGVYQIGSGREVSIAQLAEMLSGILAEETGVHAKTAAGPGLPGEVARNYVQNARAREELGWEPSVSLEDGLARTVRWFHNKE